MGGTSLCPILEWGSETLLKFMRLAILVPRPRGIQGPHVGLVGRAAKYAAVAIGDILGD